MEKSGASSVFPQLQNISWQTIVKYALLGSAIAGLSYFVARQFQSQNSGEMYKGKKTRKLRLGRDMAKPIVGSVDSSANVTETFARPVGSQAPTVKQLVLYPIKSCGGIFINSFYCGEQGPEIRTDQGIVRDRSFMLTTSKYTFITQRMKPKMSLIEPSIAGSYLEINAPGMPILRVPLCPDWKDLKTVETEVWGDKITAVDLGEEASSWFSEYLGQSGVRFIYHPYDFGGRQLSTPTEANVEVWEKGDKCAFADGAPFLLLSEESVAEFSTHLSEPVSWNHFRPNILVSGCSPYEEDSWRQFAIGNAAFRNTKPCTRCVMTTVDPKSGTFARKDVLNTLKTLRVNQSPEWESVLENNGLMAINLGLDLPETISVGDSIQQRP